MATHRLHPLLALLLALSPLSGGCRSELVHGLEEPEANRVVAVLEAQGIPAETAAEGQQGDRTWVVAVASADLGSARSVLYDNDLPDRPAAGLAEVFDQGGLLPTPTEEQARLISAVQGELVKSLESVDGVLAARVHLSMPRSAGSRIALGEAEPAATASVLLRYSSPTKAPPLTEAQVRALVSGAVQGLAPERINVVMVERPGARSDRRSQAVAVGPFSVSPRSAARLRATIVASALAVGVLGLALVVLALRTRSLRRRAVVAEAALEQLRTH